MTLVPLTSTGEKDPRLVARAVAGDVEATGKLLKQLAPGILRGARAILGADHPDLDDVVQQSMIAIVQALPQFRGECSLTHFTARIFTRIALATRRRTHVLGERQEAEIEVDSLHGEQANQAETFEATRRRALLGKLLGSINPEQAEALALRVVFGCSLPEVAAATGVPLNTVRSRVRLAKEALHRLLTMHGWVSSELEGE